MRSLIFIIYFYLLPVYAFAQYEGGIGDGADAILVIQLDLEGIPAGVRALFIGGSGDGYALFAGSNGLNGQLLTSIYGGGPGDGYDLSAANTLLSGENLAVIFGGGSGDGYDLRKASLTLNGMSVAAIYGGGPGDGFDRLPLSAALNGQLQAAIYGGGPGDGYDHFVTTGSLGDMMTMLYGGGPGDGFDHLTAFAHLNGEDIRALYRGGDGDGYAPTRYEGIIPLPLTLISFAAFPEEDYVLLRWVTEDEIGTDFFTIEKTREGRDFTWVGELPAAGFSEAGQQLTYQLKDLDPYQGTSYYRLKTTDFDGLISLSHLVQVHYAQAEDWNFQLFPNPNTGRHFRILPEGLEPGEELELEILDVNGRVLLKEQFEVTLGDAHRFDIQERLPAGSYLIRVIHKGQEQQAKILVVVKN